MKQSTFLLRTEKLAPPILIFPTVKLIGSFELYFGTSFKDHVGYILLYVIILKTLKYLCLAACINDRCLIRPDALLSVPNILHKKCWQVGCGFASHFILLSFSYMGWYLSFQVVQERQASLRFQMPKEQRNCRSSLHQGAGILHTALQCFGLEFH